MNVHSRLIHGTTRVREPNGISIRSSASAGLTFLTSRTLQREVQTTERATSAAIARVASSMLTAPSAGYTG